MSELHPGQITIGDLYRELVGMRGDLAKALTHIEVIDSRNLGADQVHIDHEARLRALEAFRWKVTGLAIAFGAGSGMLSGLLTYFLGRSH